MALYIGFYTVDPNYERETGGRARSGDGSADAAFQQRVVDLRAKLPASLRLLGSYGTRSAHQPNIWLCETDNPADLSFVSNYYTGYLVFDWVPAFAIGATVAETRATMDETAANR